MKSIKIKINKIIKNDKFIQLIENKLYSLSNKVKYRRWNKVVYKHWKERLTILCRTLGNKKLSKGQKEELRRFWGKFVNINTYDHEFYLNACDDFDVKYIPASIHYTVIDKYFNDWEIAKIVDNKTEYKRLFPNVLQPETILMRCNGFWYHDSVISNTDVCDIILYNVPCFIKLATNSEGGKGVYYIDKECTKQEINSLLNKIKGDIIIQKALEQSLELSKLNSSSVNTIRLMTLLNKNGSVKLCSACLRMGIEGSKVDNASSGGVVAGINDKGYLKKYAYKPTGERFVKHPTSNIIFENYKIPNFDKCKDLVIKLAPHYPYFRLISWDIALNQNNDPVLIEANLSSGELDFHQLNNGPIFGEDTERILKEIFKNE